ncbi:hypothetical protein PtB15_2B235 [Puccinia triticina]|nr:hypothetical protein PtB15_2B235 [Puccinia triticina]
MAQASSSNTNVFGNRNTSEDAFNVGPSSTNMASWSAGTALTANYLSGELVYAAYGSITSSNTKLFPSSSLSPRNSSECKVPSTNPNPPIPFSYYNAPQPWGTQTSSSAYTNAVPYSPNHQDVPSANPNLSIPFSYYNGPQPWEEQTTEDAFNAGPSSINVASWSAGTALTENYLSGEPVYAAYGSIISSNTKLFPPPPLLPRNSSECKVPSANPNPSIPFSYYNEPQPWGTQAYSSALSYTNAAPYSLNNQDGVHSEQLVPFTTDNHSYAAPALHLENSTAPATYETFASASSSYDNGPSNFQTPLTLSSGTPSSGYNHPSTSSGGRNNGQNDVNSPQQTGTVPESLAVVSNPEPESQLPGHGSSKRQVPELRQYMIFNFMLLQES